jgi:carboxymethylenebutenolidase
MCFDLDSRPPIAPIAGAAVDGHHVELESSDGARPRAFVAGAASSTGAGIVILPDVRGLHRYYEELALRFAEAGVDAIALDYFARTAETPNRADGFDFMAHVARTTWDGLRGDAAAAVDRLRADRSVRTVFSIGFCFGGRLSFALASVPALGLGGVIGFYGWPVGSGRNDVPSPVDLAHRMACPVLGIFGGADQGIPADAVATFEHALTAAGVQHSIVSYPDAPHSFFDRKQAAFVDASAAAWGEVLAFIRQHTQAG